MEELLPVLKLYFMIALGVAYVAAMAWHYSRYKREPLVKTLEDLETAYQYELHTIHVFSCTTIGVFLALFVLNTESPFLFILGLLAQGGYYAFAYLNVNDDYARIRNSLIAEPAPPPPEPTKQSIKDFLHKPVRFEHTHVLGAPGAGKTELLKYLISEDIETNAAVVVMAPKGNLIQELSRLTAIDSERLIIVTPEQTPALNVFDLGEGDSAQAVTLLNYVFSSVLDAETTGKQTALLNYCVRLCLVIPDATLLTLRDLLGCATLPPHFSKHVSKLSDAGKHFFTNQFGVSGRDGYQETKEQMKWRFDLLLENPIIEKMFSQTQTLVSLKDVMAGGKVLLIDTSIKQLGDFGSSFFGRYFIALIALATERRDTNRHLRPVYVYIDEASTYLTDYLESLLDRARESRVGLVLSHQHLKQLSDISTKLEASVHNTAIKFVGVVNDSDDRKMAAEMPNMEPGECKGQSPLHFWVSARGFKTMGFNVTPGYLEQLPQRTDREMKQLMARNRERLASPHLSFSEKQSPQKHEDPGTGTSIE